MRVGDFEEIAEHSVSLDLQVAYTGRLALSRFDVVEDGGAFDSEGRKLIELLGELDPQANLPHRDIREVAVDRLYRLIDVCARYGDGGARLSERCRAAPARRLSDAPTAES